MTQVDEDIVIAYREMRRAFVNGAIAIADFRYRNLRREFCLDLYYEVDLPEHVRFVHPLATVLGRATYGNHLVVYQNVGVGSDVDGAHPTFGDGVVLFPGAKVLGGTVVGNNVWITANTVVQDVIVPDNVVVFPAPVMRAYAESVVDNDGRDGFITREYTAIGCAWRPTKRSVVERYFTPSSSPGRNEDQ